MSSKVLTTNGEATLTTLNLTINFSPNMARCVIHPLMNLLLMILSNILDSKEFIHEIQNFIRLQVKCPFMLPLLGFIANLHGCLQLNLWLS
jgi:hypothetical protein